MAAEISSVTLRIEIFSEDFSFQVSYNISPAAADFLFDEIHDLAADPVHIGHGAVKNEMPD